MQGRAVFGVLTTIIILSVLLVPTSPSVPIVHAAGVPSIGVTHPQFGHNLTSLTALNPGQTFTLAVNVSDAVPIAGIDVTMSYAISAYLPNVISPDSVTFAGGLFDPTTPPQGCTTDNPVQKISPPPIYTIRMAAVIQGPCSVPGTGTLFFATFHVTGTGATSFDVLQGADAGGTQKLQIVSGASDHPLIQMVTYNAYFRNVPGVPPVAQFTYDPPSPLTGQAVTFNGTQSYDPDNSAASGKGIAKYIWQYMDNSLVDQGATLSHTSHIFRVEPTVFAAGTFEVKLVVVDADNGLPMRTTHLVKVGIPVIHDIAVTVVGDKDQITVGDTIRVTVTVYNRGNRDEQASMTVSYDNGQGTLLGQNSSFSLRSSNNIKSEYSLPTGNLAPRAYTVTAHAELLSNMDMNPLDNTATFSFTVTGTSGSGTVGLSVPLLAAGVVITLGAVGAGVYFLRRRRKDEDTIT